MTSHKARKHKVTGTIANLDLAKAGTSISLEIFANDEKIGTLEIGRGSMRWKGKNKRKDSFVKTWSQFAEWMETH